MSLDLSDFLSVLDDSPFEEIPVDVNTFVHDDQFLGLPALSKYQTDMVEAMSQIYKEEDLVRILGDKEGREHYKKYTKKEVVLMWGKGCHAPYTPIFDPSTGKWTELSSTSEGMVATVTGNEYSTEPFMEGVGDMVRVKTSLGFEEDVYIGHKYLSMKKTKFYKRFRDNNIGTFREVSEISVGDRIAIGINMSPSNPVNIPWQHAELIGYWLGDGMLPADHNPTINIDFNSNETESIARYLDLCEFIGDKPQRVDHKNKSMVSFRHGKASKAVSLARKYGMWGLRSHTKFIPDVVWASDNTVLSHTISRLWQTDGCVYSKNGMTAEYVSVSKDLAVGVQRALLRLGVPSTIRSKIPSSNFDNASRAYYVSVSSQESFNAFINAIPALLDHKNSSVLDKNGKIYARIDGNIYWDKVVSITPIGIGDYWTRTVPESGHYVGNGMVSANSGKDFASTIGCAYVVYKLLCLKDPARYYGKPSGDAIDIINVAVNAQQAATVFFSGFSTKINRSPWFAGRYKEKVGSFSFDKNINVYSGHSERESHEGLNLILAILDEISAFAQTNNTGNENAKTADAIYKAFRASVDSRFPDYGKCFLLSFPRYPGDFISKRYDEVVAEKEVEVKKHTLTINPDLPEDAEGNTFSIEWEEDHIISYKYPGIHALRRPTWVINPTRKVEDFTTSFMSDYNDSMQRFACMPSFMTDTFFRDKEALQRTMTKSNPIDDFKRIEERWKPEDDVRYFLHADLAQKHDNCAIAIAHVDKWVQVRTFNEYTQVHPFVVVDAVVWWNPKKEGVVDLSEVKDWIVSFRRQGFRIGMATFDRWNSVDIQQELRSVGIKTDTLSVGKKHYEDLAMTVYENRLVMPYIPLLYEELTELRIVSDKKVDHPRKKSKDLSDAVTGAVYNAIAHTPRNLNQEIEIHDWKSINKKHQQEEEDNKRWEPEDMPEDVASYLDNLGFL